MENGPFIDDLAITLGIFHSKLSNYQRVKKQFEWTSQTLPIPTILQFSNMAFWQIHHLPSEVRWFSQRSKPPKRHGDFPAAPPRHGEGEDLQVPPGEGPNPTQDATALGLSSTQGEGSGSGIGMELCPIILYHYMSLYDVEICQVCHMSSWYVRCHILYCNILYCNILYV